MADRVTLIDAATEATPAKQVSDVYSGYIVFQLEDAGSWSGTLTFQARLTGSEWKPIAALDLSDMSTYATTATAEGLYRVDASGLDEVRVYGTTVSAGGMNIYTKPSIG
jgi:hypothetical protein